MLWNWLLYWNSLYYWAMCANTFISEQWGKARDKETLATERKKNYGEKQKKRNKEKKDVLTLKRSEFIISLYFLLNENKTLLANRSSYRIGVFRQNDKSSITPLWYRLYPFYSCMQEHMNKRSWTVLHHSDAMFIILSSLTLPTLQWLVKETSFYFHSVLTSLKILN